MSFSTPFDNQVVLIASLYFASFLGQCGEDFLITLEPTYFVTVPQ